VSNAGEGPRGSSRRATTWIGFDDGPAPRPPLTPRRIVEAALHVVDENGLESLTIRQLGPELGVTPMAIYGHFANKEQLLDCMLDFVLGEVDLEPPDADPLDAVLSIVADVDRVLIGHQGIARVYGGSVRIGPNGLRVLDSVLGHLLRAGLDPPTASMALLALYTYTMGHHQIGRVLPVEGGEGEGPMGFLSALPPDQVPNVVHAGAHFFAAGSRAQRFRMGLDLLIAGLRGRVAATGATRGPGPAPA